jgi:RNA recognition motif-containing protein
MTWGQLSTILNYYGHIRHLYLSKDTEQKSRGYGYVEFKKTSERTECLRQHKHIEKQHGFAVSPIDMKKVPVDVKAKILF